MLNGTTKFSGFAKAVSDALQNREFNPGTRTTAPRERWIAMIVFSENGVKSSGVHVANNFADAAGYGRRVASGPADRRVIVGATFDNLQDTKKVPAAGKAITGIQGCVAVDKMTDLPKAPEHDAVNPQS